MAVPSRLAPQPTTSTSACRLFSTAAGATAVPGSPPSPRRAPADRRRPAMTTLPAGHPRSLPDVWFSGTFPAPGSGGKPPDERTLQLGKTLRILQERLPTLLQSPLPADILSPNISLHLFPSTHPHLPVVSGRVAYIAALWTSPLAWGRVPIVGNVRLEILSERMTKQPVFVHAAPRRLGAGDEQLIVRWRTVGAGRQSSSLGGASVGAEPGAGPATSSPRPGSPDADLPSGQLDSTSTAVSPSAADPTKEFTGLFIFDFDQKGRILSHTIEHVSEGGNWERSVGARFVGLTDWLLGGMRGSGGGETPVPAFEMQDPRKLL